MTLRRSTAPRTHSIGRRVSRVTCLAFMVVMTLCGPSLFSQDAKLAVAPAKSPASVATSATPAEAEIAAARERAKLLHDVYTTTLDVMHHHYFRRDGPVLPARAMEDVFEGMAGSSGTMANWISVNTKAMSINHEPTTKFEKQAAVEIASGKESFERIAKRVYQRATAIPLRSNCVGCHTKMFSEEPKSQRFAGLVISIPLQTEK